MASLPGLENLPEKLVEYFAGGKEKKEHLKLLATIGDTVNKSGEGKPKIHWAVFFTIRPEKPAGHDEFYKDYKGKVLEPAGKKLRWNTERVLWLIPISIEARDEAIRSLRDPVKKNKPAIASPEIIIRNDGSGISDWTQYQFWYDTIKEKDLFLKLAPDSSLTQLSEKGEWLLLQCADDAQAWPVWLAAGDITAQDRQVAFSAPVSHIVNNNGGYTEHEAWFGTYNGGLHKTYPFLTLSFRNTNYENDYPVLWKGAGAEGKRHENFLTVPDPESDKLKATTQKWKTRIPFKDGPTRVLYEITQSFYFNDKNDVPAYNPDALYSWLLHEGKYLYCTYIRHYLSSDGVEKRESAFHRYLGSETSPNYISVIQVNRAEKISLLTRISDFNYSGNHCFSDIWSKISSSIRDSLNSVKASSPVGLTPIIDNKDNNTFYSYISEWQAEYDNKSTYISVASLILSEKDGADELSDLKCTTLTLPLLHHQGAPVYNDSSLLVLKTPSFSSFKLELGQEDNGTLFQVTLSDYESIVLSNGKAELPDDIILRDGAMAFGLGGKLTGENFPPSKLGNFKLIFQTAKEQKPFYLWQWHKNIEKQDALVLSYVISDFLLPVNSIEAAGQDRLLSDRFLAPASLGTISDGLGERSEPPLIINLNKPGLLKSPFALSISESVNISQDHRVTMKLIEFDARSGVDNSSEINAVVLDGNPQFVGLVKAKFLQQPGFDDGAWVLATREEEGGWRLLDDEASTEGFQLVLPAQAIGEAYVKKNTPVPGDGEPEVGVPIAYRFGAPAILRLAPERLDKRYVTAPWNLRRIWGQPGEVSPGIPLLEAQFEFLYGLTGNLKPVKAFLAELASKLGEVPIPPANTMAWNPTEDQRGVFEERWKAYRDFYRSWKSRLAILEPSVDDHLGSAKFDEFISFKPRIDFQLIVTTIDILDDVAVELAKADPNTKNYAETGAVLKQLRKDVVYKLNHRTLLEKKKTLVYFFKSDPAYTKCLEALENDNTIQYYQKIGASLRYPLEGTPDAEIGNVLTEEELKNDLNKKIKAAHSRDGLAGGFHYGFESKAIYNEFWRESFKKGSSSGELLSPAFSSLGGWAKQTARFAADKTVIKSSTSMGRTQFYAVERIGRIGAFWNKAKHVIEYERTSVPSEQFKDQPAHAGRVLDRKVREYVEILEPTRKYPDFTTSLPDAPGAVMACTFKSKIIPVLSSWGHDVISGTDAGTAEPVLIGWEVPLWMPGANPKVYVKPQVQLELMPPPDSDEKTILANLSEPENLWFYTDTREKVGDIPITAEVHKWPAVKNVDYTELPEPEQYDIEPAAGDSPLLLEAQMPDVLDVFPGFERFTFKVDKNEIPAAVTARYYPKSGISGRLRTVSMMRGFERKGDFWEEGHADVKLVKDALQSLTKGAKSLLANYANGFPDLEKKAMAGQLAPDDFKNHIKSFIEKEIHQKLKAISPEVDKPQLSHFSSLWGTVENGHPSKGFSYPTKWLWREALGTADSLVNRILGLYKDQSGLLLEELELLLNSAHYKEDAINALNKFDNCIETFHVEVDFKLDNMQSKFLEPLEELEAQVQQVINRSFNEVSCYLDELTSTENITAQKQKIKDKLQRKLKQLNADIDALLSKVENLKIPKWIPASDTGEWTTKVGQIKTSVSQVINTFLGELKDIDDIASSGLAFVNAVRQLLYQKMSGYKTKVNSSVNLLFVESKLFLKDTTNYLKEINKGLFDVKTEVLTRVKSLVTETIGQLENGTVFAIEVFRNTFKKLGEDISLILVPAVSKVLYNKEQPKDEQQTVFGILYKLDDLLISLGTIIKSSLLGVFGAENLEIKISEWIDSFESYKRLQKAIQEKNLDAVLNESRALAGTVNREFGRLAGEVARKVKDLDSAVNSGNEVIQTGKETLTNFRSVWEEFTAPGMGLNRKTIALIVKTNPKDIQQRLSITPCITRVKQFGQELEGLGLRAPAAFITDRLLPAVHEAEGALQEMGKSLLSKFDFSSLLSDIGGMRLDKLFPGFKMPEFARDNIKITQGFDKQNLIAWVNAEVDLLLPDKKVIMSYGPLQVFLEGGLFKAKTRIEINSEGRINKNNSGKIQGSWHIAVSGTSLMIFRDTAVTFNNGKFKFDLDPSKMEMPGLLKLLSDATQSIDGGAAGGGEDGEGSVFKIGLLKQNGVPTGMRASLDLPPTSVGGGPSGISNLCFGGFFMLSFLDQDLKSKFMTGVGFYVGTRETPFTLTIFILGGGGYIEYAMYFDPKTGYTIRFAMSVHVSATFEVAIGWMQGGLTIRLGLEGIYYKEPGRNTGSYVSIFVEIVGHVEIIRLISVQLSLLLQATYATEGNSSRLFGTGRVRLTIRVCRFITIKVEKSYSKTFSQSGSGANKIAPHTERADAVLNSLN